jgi:hypothetical protein
MGWFEVHKKGLAALLEQRGKAFAIFELIANAWDTKTPRVSVHLGPPDRTATATLLVEDEDPEGFRDLSHAFTLFASSMKADDVAKRGRFNLGEKLVLALCKEATITSTTGTVRFACDGTRTTSRSKRERGSLFDARIRMTKAEREAVCAAVLRLLPPVGMETLFNDTPLVVRKPLASFEYTLPTQLADAAGVLRSASRKTTVRVYESLSGHSGTLYEMGIPVVETGDTWDIDIGQKVPLSMERDNVPPAYLRELRAAVLSELHSFLTPTTAGTGWVSNALESGCLSTEAVLTVIQQRHGEKVAIADPSDPEASKQLVSDGYAIIHGGAYSGKAWESIKRAGVRPAGAIKPTPKPFSAGGPSLQVIPLERYTAGMRRVAEYAKCIAVGVLGTFVRVQIANDVGWPFLAAYGPSGDLTLNVGRLGHSWFDGPIHKIDELLIHEFGHHTAPDHLSAEYHKALCRIGAQIAGLWRMETGYDLGKFVTVDAWIQHESSGSLTMPG